MFGAVNRVFLSGNLGATPELRVTPKGTPVAELRMAANYRVKVGEQWVDRTDWHSIDVFGQNAEFAARYLTKGSAVFVEGALRVDTWIDKETDKKRSKVRIFGDRVHSMNSRPRSDAPPITPTSVTLVPEPSAEMAPMPEPTGASEEEIPF
jgi:single-strand DNA-binding protein